MLVGFPKNKNSFSFPSVASIPIPPQVLVYHDSARSIVFREEMNFTTSISSDESQSKESTKSEDMEDPSFNPKITSLPPLKLKAEDEFPPLLNEIKLRDLTEPQKEVVSMLHNQLACVKTIKNDEWETFLRHFLNFRGRDDRMKYSKIHDDIPPNIHKYTYNSFVTSSSLLPSRGLKMRTFGSLAKYTVGVVFALPKRYQNETEAEAVRRSKTWAWPAGYAAKTAFNIDDRGCLINGREDALISLEMMRQHNNDYVTKDDYEILGRKISRPMKSVPYNEVFLRVGGLGRLVNGKDVVSGEDHNDEKDAGRTLDKGVGLPVALFIRSPTYGHLISLLRTRTRCSRILGAELMKDIPLLLITPQHGVRVFTNAMEQELLKIIAQNLNPFQNRTISHKTTLVNTSEQHMLHKMEELFDLDTDNMLRTLTPEERVRVAGGFGATDESLLHLLVEAKRKDDSNNSGNVNFKELHTSKKYQSSTLQSFVCEGLTAAARSNDYHIARQILILYSLVATQGDDIGNLHRNSFEGKRKVRSFWRVCNSGGILRANTIKFYDTMVDEGVIDRKLHKKQTLPPIDTDGLLRSVINSKGVLSVLGAAQILKATHDDDGIKERVYECISAINEWIEHGEESVVFRLASWKDQLAAQADLHIAMEYDSSWAAFVGSKAIANRKKFAKDLEEALSSSNFQCLEFLKKIHDIISNLNKPCLRLELLQFILGLDNRFSVALLDRSVELAIICLSIEVIAA